MFSAPCHAQYCRGVRHVTPSLVLPLSKTFSTSQSLSQEGRRIATCMPWAMSINQELDYDEAQRIVSICVGRGYKCLRVQGKDGTVQQGSLIGVSTCALAQDVPSCDRCGRRSSSGESIVKSHEWNALHLPKLFTRRYFVHELLMHTSMEKSYLGELGPHDAGKCKGRKHHSVNLGPFAHTEHLASENERGRRTGA